MSVRGLKLPSPGWLFLLTGFWLACVSWVRPLTLPDEGRYAGVAWDMLRAGEYVVPLLNGLPFFHKPPLYYWLTEAAFTVFGVQPWVARIPSWLAAWAAALAIYVFVRRYRGPCTAIAALGCLVTQPFFYGGAQFANLDMLVASMITLTVLAGASTILRINQGEPYRLMALTTGVVAGLGVLAKGLIGVVLPGGILLLWVVLLRYWRPLATLCWPPLVAVGLLVALPWFWMMYREFPDFLHYFFIYQQFERFTAETFNNRQPVWFYVPVVAVLILPWTLWLGGIFRKTFWVTQAEQAVHPDQRHDQAYAVRSLMAVWAGVIFLFFSLPSSKLLGYVLPLLPPLAVLVAEVVIRGMQQNVHRARQRYGICLVAAATICFLIVFLFSLYAHPNAMPLANAARAAFKADDQVVMLHAYAYDLPMALHDPKPAWVVDEWERHEKIKGNDNWRKELYDAGQFWPDKMKQLLISEQELQTRLCAAHTEQTFWVWGDPKSDGQRYAVLHGIPLYVTTGPHALWRVVPDAAFKSRHCGAANADTN
jgi:4-amino-4-deoxy-L-arabinose transferase-like glycosyltransferase